MDTCGTPKIIVSSWLCVLHIRTHCQRLGVDKYKTKLCH